MRKFQQVTVTTIAGVLFCLALEAPTKASSCPRRDSELRESVVAIAVTRTEIRG